MRPHVVIGALALLGLHCNDDDASKNDDDDGGMPLACDADGNGCPADMICVAYHAGAGPMTDTTYECEPDLCAPSPTACNCSGSLCADRFTIELCNISTNGVLNCDNGAVCAAPDTPVDTPSGPRAIAQLQQGDLVWSVHRATIVAVPIARQVSRRVSDHAVSEFVFDNGDVLRVSGAHPTGDGRLLADLAVGSMIGARRVRSIATVAYDETHTFDILPASDSGTYFAAGAWLGSTLHRSILQRP